MREFTKIFKALSDEGRLRILNLLSQKPLCVCEITAVLNLAISTVSKHLSILREAGYIIDQKEGKWVNYFLNSSASEPVKSLTALVLNGLIHNKTAQSDIRSLATVDRVNICGMEKHEPER